MSRRTLLCSNLVQNFGGDACCKSWIGQLEAESTTNTPRTQVGALGFLTRVSFKHREIDKEILGLDPLVSRGWQSMGILHFQGLKRIHSGALEGLGFGAVVPNIEPAWL